MSDNPWNDLSDALSFLREVLGPQPLPVQGAISGRHTDDEVARQVVEVVEEQVKPALERIERE